MREILSDTHGTAAGSRTPPHAKTGGTRIGTRATEADTIYGMNGTNSRHERPKREQSQSNHRHTPRSVLPTPNTRTEAYIHSYVQTYNSTTCSVTLLAHIIGA
eukprot:TRINITY_DN15367_c0_g1::TRINITY_DN15367_c0_g1_i1::g.22698::m.22698 TRINITY_DN15367_c0_g1::TRINITY_DN15367_c0_g1_i1::g.22698  ORF type:complete len:103 (-),score=-15.31,MAP65_ASE1/PF03999.7/0.94 TRINITY_DN15367_c0_g1_i1:438-746(-)